MAGTCVLSTHLGDDKQHSYRRAVRLQMLHVFIAKQQPKLTDLQSLL